MKEFTMESMFEGMNQYKSEVVACKSFPVSFERNGKTFEDTVTAVMSVVKDAQTEDIVNGSFYVRNSGGLTLGRKFTSYRDAIEAAEEVAANYLDREGEWRV